MLFSQDATYYADQVKKGQVTPLELVESALENIRALNPTLNAVTTVIAENALQEAREKTALLDKLTPDQRADLPAFYGVPTLLKDLGQHLKGLRSTSGAKILQDFVPDATNHYTQALVDAGFIIVGTTNTPEFGFKGISDSKANGPVQSPFQTGYNPGGSSGGAAAALKSGMVPIAMASDGGGSVRIPASYTGLIGFKPSRGRIIVGPDGYRGWQGATVNFGLTRSVRDTWALLKVLQAEQYEAPFMVPKITQEELTDLKRPLKIAYSLKGVMGQDLGDQARAAILHAKNQLEKLGHNLVEDDPGLDIAKSFKGYYMMNTIEAANMLDGIQESLGRPIQFEDVEPLTWLMSQAGKNVKATALSRVLDEWDQTSVYLEKIFQKYDAIVFPIANGPAPKQGQFDPDQDLIDRIKDIDRLNPDQQQDLLWEYFTPSHNYMGFNSHINLAGQPSIALPLYQTDQGWPIGVQIWSRKGADFLLLQIAKQLEEAGQLKTDIQEV